MRDKTKRLCVIWLTRLAKLVVIAVFCFYILITLHFIISPIASKTLTKILVHKIANLSEARNYYTIISAITTVLTSLTGICLGYFYYRHKQNVDSINSKRERVRSRLNVIVSELKLYEECIHDILFMAYHSDDELNKLRSKASRYFDNIVVFLEASNHIHELSEADVRTILLVNSHVDKSEQLMKVKFKDILPKQMLEEKEKFCELIRNAKSVCFCNME